MNLFQNLNHDIIHFDSTKDYSLNIEAIKNHLKENEKEIHILREKVGTLDHIKEEIVKFKILIKDYQQTVEHTTENHKQSYDNISQDLNRISMKYKQTQNNIDILQQNNHKLRCNIQSKKSKELEIIDNINNLKKIKLKAIKCNNELQNKIHKEQVNEKQLDQKITNLEESMVCKNVDTYNAHCDLAEMKTRVRGEFDRLGELQRLKAERDWTLRETKSECRKRDAELIEIMNDGRERLARAERLTEAANEELSEGSRGMAEWTDRRKRAVKMYRELKCASDAKIRDTRSMITELCRERDRLTDWLSDASDRLMAAESNYKSLVTDVKSTSDRLDSTTIEVQRLEETLSKDKMQTSKRIVYEKRFLKYNFNIFYGI